MEKDNLCTILTVLLGSAILTFMLVFAFGYGARYMEQSISQAQISTNR